jgi:hypothetical protein
MLYALSLVNFDSDLMVLDSGITVEKFTIAVADIRRRFLNQGNRIFPRLLLLVKSFFGNQYAALGSEFGGSQATA